MSLQDKLAARVAAGKPVRVGLIGAGKFGSMFLAQVPTHRRSRDRGHRRPRSGARQGRLPHGRLGRRRGSRARASPTAARDACRRGVEVVIEATGNPAAGHRARARRDRCRQAYRHGQCRGRRAVRLAAGRTSARARRRLLDGLRRSAGAGRRNGRLGALGRLHGRGSRQGHQISAVLSHRHARRRLDALRPHRRTRPRRPA